MKKSIAQFDRVHIPAVSICMAAYNAEHFLRETLNSIVAQSFEDFEVVFVDDGSSDKTLAIAREYAARDSRIRVFAHESNRGLIESRNLTVREAKAPLVAIADSDDCLHAERLQRQVNFLNDHPEIGVLGTAVKFVSDDGRKEPTLTIYHEDASIRFFMRFLPCFWNTTTVYRRELIDYHEVYRAQFSAGAEDYDLWYRLLPKTKFANLPEALVTVRLHGASVTAVQSKCLSNVLTISNLLLNEYYGLNLTVEDRVTLHRFMIFEGLSKDSVERAFEILEVLRRQAKVSEPPIVYSIFCQLLSRIYLTHSVYMTYVSPVVSRKLLAKSYEACPTCLGSMNFWKQAARSNILSRIRHLDRRIK